LFFEEEMMGQMMKPFLTGPDGEGTSLQKGDTITIDNGTRCIFILRRTDSGNKVKLDSDDKIYFGPEPVSGAAAIAFVRLLAAASRLGYKCNSCNNHGLCTY
jgi:hypothetical protein